MTDRDKLKRNDGYVFFETATTRWDAPRSCWEKACNAIETGATWLEFTSILGCEVRMRVDELVEYGYISPAAAQNIYADLDQQREEARIEGM